MSDDTNEPRRPRPGGPDARRRVRIGDTEREALQAALAEHLAAGRLDMPEYERRVEQTTAAVYADDLDGLLDDLPRTEHDPDAGAGHGRRSRHDAWRPGREGPPWAGNRDGRPPWDGWVRRSGIPVPLLIALGFVAVFALGHGGWVLFPLLWVMFFVGAGRRLCGGGYRGFRDHRHGHDHGRYRGHDDRIEV